MSRRASREPSRARSHFAAASGKVCSAVGRRSITQDQAQGWVGTMSNRTSHAKFLAIALSLCTGAVAAGQSAPSPHIYHVEGDVEGVHDPSIIAQNGTWYLFGTATEKGPHAQLPMRCSTRSAALETLRRRLRRHPRLDPKRKPGNPRSVGTGYFLLQREISRVLRVFGVWKKYFRHRPGYQQNARPIQPRFSLGGRGPRAEIPGQRRFQRNRSQHRI